ncbi:MAG: outer membrane beta-barrel protein [Bacteroidia bacterium]|nr:outer membrane beta-barrel protein [Bacteroidia bacterium]
MKKNQLVLVFLLIVLSRINLTAQENTSLFSYGLRLGSGFSGFTHNHEVFTQKKSGLAAGLFAEVNPAPFLGISFEADYLMEGAFHVSPYLIYPESSVSYSGGLIYKYASDVTLHNIHLPVLINIRPITKGVSPTFSLGYSFDFFLTAISHDMIMSSGTSLIPVTDRSIENVASSFEKWNMGPVAGVGIKFPGLKFNYSFDVRYKVGLLDINNLAGLNSLNGQYDFSVNTLIFFLTISK